MLTVSRQRIKTSSLLKIDKEIFKEKPNKELQKGRKTWLIHHDNKMAGYILVDESRKNLIKIEKFGILANYRRIGLMKLAFNVMFTYYKGKMIFCSISEKSLDGQMFLKSMNFVCKSISENRDNYVFQYQDKTKNLEHSLIGEK